MPSSAPAAPESHPLSLHDALPILAPTARAEPGERLAAHGGGADPPVAIAHDRAEEVSERAVELLDRRLEDRLDVGHAGEPGAELVRSEEHTSELQSPCNLVCRLLLPPPPSPTLFPYTTLFRSWLQRLAPSRANASPRTAAALTRPSRSRTTAQRKYPNARWSSSTVASRIASTSVMPASRAPSSLDRKSTRLNSSHLVISYAVFCSRRPRVPPSFPTRRSSDLGSNGSRRAGRTPRRARRRR